MKKTNISQNDAETIMIALDQVSQTIDVMTIVIDRLKLRIHASLDRTEKNDRVPTEKVKSPNHGQTLKSDSIH
jgi:hypothetical protein